MLMVTCGHGLVLAQRSLEEILVVEPVPNHSISHAGIVLGDEVLIAGNQSLFWYDGTSSIEYDYPTRDGASLEFSDIFGRTSIFSSTSQATNPLPVLGSVIYLTLEDISGRPCPVNEAGNVYDCPRYLYQFNSGVITPSPITDQTLSNVVIFQNKLYVVATAGGVTKLLSFDGTAVNEVIPFLGLHDLYTIYTTNNHLYLGIQDNLPLGSEVNFKRYDGLDFIDIPPFDLGGQWVREIHEVDGTDIVYFVSESDVTVFDGTDVTEIITEEEDPLEISDFDLLNGVAFFLLGSHTLDLPFFSGMMEP